MFIDNDGSDSSSFDQSIPQMVATTNIDNLVQIIILTYKKSLTLINEIAVVNQFFVEVVYFSIFSHNAHTGLCCEYLLGLLVKGEWSSLVFYEHSRVEYSVSLCSED
jgi:hypothetical protein